MNGCNHTTEQSCLRGNECAQCLRELQRAVNTLRAEKEHLKANLSERVEYCYKTIVQRDQWREDAEQGKKLLGLAQCPNCDGSGAKQISETEIAQCQWCDERRQLLEKKH